MTFRSLAQGAMPAARFAASAVTRKVVNQSCDRTSRWRRKCQADVEGAARRQGRRRPGAGKNGAGVRSARSSRSTSAVCTCRRRRERCEVLAKISGASSSIFIVRSADRGADGRPEAEPVARRAGDRIQSGEMAAIMKSFGQAKAASSRSTSSARRRRSASMAKRAGRSRVLPSTMR